GQNAAHKKCDCVLARQSIFCCYLFMLLMRVNSDKVLVTARLIPERQLYAVPEPQFVVDGAEIVLDDVFSGSDFVCNFSVFKSLGNEFDNSLFPVIGFSASDSCEHSCLRYKSVASFTRLTPPVMPNRTNSRLKWALTVRRAMCNCWEISSLSQPCRSSSTTCRSLGRNDFSSITSPRLDLSFANAGT